MICYSSYSLVALRLVLILLMLQGHQVVLAAPTTEQSFQNRRPVGSIHKELLAKFTPIDQPVGDVGINHSGEVPFVGDCDDYYTAAFNQLYRYGYDPFAYILSVRGTAKPHIVACVNTDRQLRCLDHNRQRVSGRKELKQWYNLIEIRKVASGDS